MPTVTIFPDLDPNSFATTQAEIQKLKENLENIQELVLYPLMREAVNKIVLSAQMYAPKRTGYMASQIQAEDNKVMGHAHYTWYVGKGHMTRSHRRFFPGQFFMNEFSLSFFFVFCSFFPQNLYRYGDLYYSEGLPDYSVLEVTYGKNGNQAKWKTNLVS